MLVLMLTVKTFKSAKPPFVHLIEMFKEKKIKEENGQRFDTLKFFHQNGSANSKRLRNTALNVQVYWFK
jgi:hypothetical protein